MDDKIYVSCVAIEAVATAVQPEQVFQWISLGITILSAAFGLFCKIRAWQKAEKKEKEEEEKKNGKTGRTETDGK